MEVIICWINALQGLRLRLPTPYHPLQVLSIHSQTADNSMKHRGKETTPPNPIEHVLINCAQINLCKIMVFLWMLLITVSSENQSFKETSWQCLWLGISLQVSLALPFRKTTGWKLLKGSKIYWSKSRYKKKVKLYSYSLSSNGWKNVQRIINQCYAPT